MSVIGRPLSGRPLGGRPLDGRALGNPVAMGDGAVGRFSPSSIYADGNQGVPLLPGTPHGVCYVEATGALATTVCGNGDPCGTYKCNITDRYLVAPSDSARPVYTVSAGLTWLEFDGIDDLIETAVDLILPQTWAAAAAVQFANLTGIVNVVDSDRGPLSGFRYAQMIRRSTSTAQAIAFNTVPSAFTESIGTVVSGAPQVLTVNRSPTTLEGWVGGVSNGATATTGTPANVTAGVRYGASRSGAAGALAGFLQGRIYAGFQLGREWAGAERTQVETYLRTKAGL